VSDASEPHAPRTVVVVDDTVDLRQLVTLALERSGEFRVVGQAGDGREAIDMVAVHKPDLVLLDIAMPIMDGIEALPHIRDRSPSTVVVMLSAFSDAEMSARAIAGGAAGCAQKGLPAQSLLMEVRGLLDEAGRSGA
jgi:DNA-binding NarL/FixJ family response regulator